MKTGMIIPMQPIGFIHSCFPDKFGIPRQARLVAEACATLELLPPFDMPEALRGLEDFSHIWLIFVFHAHLDSGWRPTVRPPRLGGNKRLGVFATRSPFRPNPIGLSAVELTGIDMKKGRSFLHLRGVDLLDGTPVVDIKPYIPYADALPDARGSFASEAPDRSSLSIDFAPQAQAFCHTAENIGHSRLETLIRQVLENDPRPAYYANRPGRQSFGMRLLDLEVQWQIEGQRILVVSIKKSIL
jgi:tRNA-Thr(GGU) m(6)t(6)A37 methyltransferase TsaA